MARLTDIHAQIESLKKQADVLRAKEFGSTLAEIRQLMAAYGITVKDLQAIPKNGSRKLVAGKKAATTGTKRPKAITKVEAKYRGPAGETWSGRGMMPKWLASLIAQGRSKGEFAIAAAQPPQGPVTGTHSSVQEPQL